LDSTQAEVDLKRIMEELEDERERHAAVGCCGV
jgi:hypothetical protein